MSDFFSRLAQRTLGIEPIVRADLPPLLAAARGETPSSEAPTAPESAKATGSPGVETGALGRGAELFVSAREQPALAGRLPDAAFLADQPRRTRARAADAPPDIPLNPDRVPASASSVKRDPAGIHSRSLFNAHEPTSVADERPWDAPSARHNSARADAMPPAVHVSIGRIEVRATTAPPRQSAAERRPPARLSLEQYLRERNGGRR